MAVGFISRRSFIFWLLASVFVIYVLALVILYLPSLSGTNEFISVIKLRIKPLLNAWRRNATSASEKRKDPATPVAADLPVLPESRFVGKISKDDKIQFGTKTNYKLPSCNTSVRRPPVDSSAQSLHQWIAVEKQKTFVYSAFYDQWGESPLIRIIAIKRSGLHTLYHCLIWYEDQELPDLLTAFFDPIPESSCKRYF